MSWQEFGSVAFSVLLGIWFLGSAFAKAMEAQATAAALSSYLLVPERLAPVLVRYLATIEAVLGCALVLGVWPDWSLGLASGLLIVVSVVVATDVLRGETHACGCGGSEQPIGWGLVARNLLAACGGLVAIAPRDPSAWERVAVGAPVVGLIVAIAGVRRYRDLRSAATSAGNA